MKKYLLSLIILLPLYSISHAKEIKDFDIKNTKLGMTPEQVRSVLGSGCNSLEEKVTNGVINSYFMGCYQLGKTTLAYHFDNNKKAYSIERHTYYQKVPNWSIISNQVNKKYGMPNNTGSFVELANNNKYEVMQSCWGLCKTEKVNNFRKGVFTSSKRKGVSFNVQYGITRTAYKNKKPAIKHSVYMLLQSYDIANYIRNIERSNSQIDL
jgi:hypothetical protein